MSAGLETALSRKSELIKQYLLQSSKAVRSAVELLLFGERLGLTEGVALYREASLPLLSLVATYLRLKQNGLATYYNRNAHIEPTNICLFNCKFCSFRRDTGAADAWQLSLEDIEQRVRSQALEGNTEIHITGGVDPTWRLEDLERIVSCVRAAAPSLHIKAFSAVELIAICKRTGIGMREGLLRLQAAGLSSIPGGGAEILDESIRKEICPEKCTGAEWLSLHREAHRLGLKSNATMLFGHIEQLEHRVSHLLALRALQDETHGFLCFIPLKYRASHNALSSYGEVSLQEVLRTYAMSRILLDNIPHLKCYWPMLGKGHLAIALHYGVDDLDGTIGNSTRIYSMAGAQDSSPSATVEELENLIRNEGYEAYERDSEYRIIERK